MVGRGAYADACCCGKPRGSAGPAPARGLELLRAGGTVPLSRAFCCCRCCAGCGETACGGRADALDAACPFPTAEPPGDEAVGLELGIAAAIAAGRPPLAAMLFSAALIISSSSTFNAAHKTIHSTMSSLPSPNVCQTAFSSGVFPVIVTLVPPPPLFALLPGAAFFWIFPNSIRLGGMR